MKPKIKIVDVLAGTEIEREMTLDEINEFERQNAEYAKRKLSNAEELERVQNLKINAFKKIGLSDEEIAVLVEKPQSRNPV